MDRFFQKISKITELLCCVMFGVMCCGVTLQVLNRYTLQLSIFWVEEMARYGMIWIVFLGAIAGIYRNAHTRVEFFVNKFPQKAQSVMKMLSAMLCVVFLSAIVYSSWQMAPLWSMMSSTALDIPMVCIYGSLGFCSVFMILYLVRNLVLEFIKGKGDKPC